MNSKRTELISARINLGLLSSITGMLKEVSTRGNHLLVASQVTMQAEMQGYDVTTEGFANLMKAEIEFVCPAFIAADIFTLIVETTEDEALSPGQQGAYKLLQVAWAPFAQAAADSMGISTSIDEITDILPESLN